MSDTVEFRHLEYLIAIYESKNFTRGAERVYRSQPAVSQQIRALEDDIGFPIFVRGGRQGVTPTVAGELILNWAEDVLTERREIFITARAIHNGEVPPLKLGFSPFVNPSLLRALRSSYEELFPSCEIQLYSGSTMHTLQRLSHGGLDCAILPMPIDKDQWIVVEVARSPLVICMRSDDPLASQTEVEIHEAAPRLKVFRDPELHPSAHSRLAEMFHDAGVPLRLASSAATPADMQWMVRENYGLALIDQLSVLDLGLVTRPIAGVNWTADIAFVCRRGGTHMAVPFIEKRLRQEGLNATRKDPKSARTRPQQLRLID